MIIHLFLNTIEPNDVTYNKKFLFFFFYELSTLLRFYPLFSTEHYILMIYNFQIGLNINVYLLNNVT